MQPGKQQRLGEQRRASLPSARSAGVHLKRDHTVKALPGQPLTNLGTGLPAPPRDKMFVADRTAAVSQVNVP
jgi:hypothetical protein